MHAELLRSVIKKQAGTLGKAVLEGVMNSIDAGSTRVDVTIDALQVTIKDDGKGFKDRNEIDLFFKTFGQPHTEGDARYGRFRMGRGQMFAFGKNHWKTGEFEMFVDIDTKIGFDLHTGTTLHKGCSIVIDLYDGLSQNDIYSVTREAEQMVKWSNIPIFINGVQINKDPSKASWTQITDEAYIKITENGRSLDVYNDGVFVESISTWKYGVSGTVVSRKTLDVNFARNQVLEKCPVWKKIKTIIDQRGEKTVKAKLSLTEDERVNVISRLKAGTMRPYEVKKMKIFVDVKGQPWSPDMVLRAKFTAFSVAKSGDHGGDSLMQRELAFVFDQENADLFGVEYPKLLEQWSSDWGNSKMPLYADINTLSEGIDISFTPINKKDWTMRERIWVRLIERMIYDINACDTMRYLNYGSPQYHAQVAEANKRRRDIRIGSCDSALAWTDGGSYIYYSRKYLKGLVAFAKGAPNAAAIMEVLRVTIHELCHDTDSRENVHSPEFYQAFHDMFKKVAPSVLAKSINYLSPARYKALTVSIQKQSKNIVDDLAEVVESSIPDIDDYRDGDEDDYLD